MRWTSTETRWGLGPCNMGGGSRGPARRWRRLGVGWGLGVVTSQAGGNYTVVKPGVRPLTPLGWLVGVQAGAQQAGSWGGPEPQVSPTDTLYQLSKGLPLGLARCE